MILDGDFFIRILDDDFVWWFWMTIFVWWFWMLMFDDDFEWWVWMMILNDDCGCWFCMMIFDDDFKWWFWMMILNDDFGWWFWMVIFDYGLSKINNSRPWAYFGHFSVPDFVFSRTGFFFAFFWKNASEIFAFGKAALPSPSPPRYSTIIRRNDHLPNWDSVHFPMFPHACLKKKKHVAVWNQRFSTKPPWAPPGMYYRFIQNLVWFCMNLKYMPGGTQGGLVEKRGFQTATRFFLFKPACGNIGKCTESQFGGWSILTYDCWISKGWGCFKCRFSNCEMFRCVFFQNNVKRKWFANKNHFRTQRNWLEKRWFQRQQQQQLFVYKACSI